MGYRSDVAITIKKSVTIPEKVKKELNEFDVKREYNNHTYYETLGVKWYDSYEDVITIENFLNSLESFDYGFIRIGEEHEDIEIKGSLFDFSLYVHQSFSTCYMT